jgi:PAS domain S-box-containing protein
MKITAKLALIFALLSMVSIGVISYLAYRNSREMIVRDKYGDLVADNDHIQAAFERWVDDRLQTLKTTAIQPFFRNSFADLMAAHDISDPAHMLAHLTIVNDWLEPLVESGKFQEVFILRPVDGVVTFSTNKAQEEKRFSTQPFYRNGKNMPFVQNVYYSMSMQQAAMTVSAPVKDKTGKLVAVLAAHLNLADLSNIMEEGRQFRPTHDTYLVNKFNFFVTEPRFGKDYALKKTVQTKGVNAALAGKTGIDLYPDYRNNSVIGAYRWMPDWQMCLISEVDQSVAFAPIYGLQKRGLFISGMVSLFAALAGWLIALTISRPLKQLSKDAENIGKGNLDVTVLSAGKDEIGELSKSFQQMAAELKTTLVSRDALAKEISERKKIEAELRQSETKFRILSEASPTGIFIIRQADLKLAYANPAVGNIFGYSEFELVDKRGPMELTHPDDHAATQEHLKQVMADETMGPFSFKGVPRDGGDLVCEAVVRTTEIDGEPMFIGTLVDATDRVRAKEQVKKEQAFSDMVINSLPGVFYLFDEKNLRFQRWNRNFETVTGYSSSELARMSPLELFDEQERVRVGQRIGEVFETGYATVEANFLTKSGDQIPYFFNGRTLKDDGINYLIGMGIDLTERKRAEQALLESEDRFKRLAENAKDMIYRMSLPDGKYEYVSPAGNDIFGYAPDVFYNRPFLIREAIHEDWREYFAEQWRNLLNGDMPPTYEYQIVDATGKVKWLNQRNVLIRDAENRPTAIEGIVTDVTDIKRATIEQIRLEKFSVLGQVAAGVAHELNNPLMGILNYAQYCISETDESDERYTLLQDIEKETKRCADLVSHFLSASRQDDVMAGKVEGFDPRTVIESVLKLLEYRVSKEGVAVATNFSPNTGEMRMGREAFQQLFMNLFTNALDAVETSIKKEIHVHIQKETKNIILTVSDSGSGVSPKLKEKIFDPFFTTKPPGKGTGLGLATCWKIVMSQKGRIECLREKGLGTKMVVTMPTNI